MREAATVAGSFDELVQSDGPRLLRVAYMLSGDRHTAEDLMQATLASAYRHWDRVAAADSPPAYLRTMLVNEFLSWRRRRSSGELPSDRIDDSPTEGPADQQAEQDAAWRLLARLPRQQRAVLVLRYYEDLADDDIARVLGCTASTVRSNAARALAALRTAVPTLTEEHLK